MVEKSMDLAMIQGIIETCSRFGVRELKYLGLCVDFNPKVEITPSTPEAEISEIQHKRLTETELKNEEIRTREDEIAELAVTDPLEYEKQLSSGELLEDEDESGTDESDK